MAVAVRSGPRSPALLLPRQGRFRRAPSVARPHHTAHREESCPGELRPSVHFLPRALAPPAGLPCVKEREAGRPVQPESK